MVELPEVLNLESSKLCDFVFHNHYAHHQDHEWLASTAIITATNDATKVVNSYMMQKFLDDEKLYQISDRVDQEHIYPLEFINYLNLSVFPPHMLRFKVRVCIMHLKNQISTMGTTMEPVRSSLTSTTTSSREKLPLKVTKTSDCSSPTFHWCWEKESFLSI